MIAEMLLGLTTSCFGGQGRQLPDATRKAVAGLVPAIEKARLYRGRGGEVMRGATARLLEVQALLHMPSGPKTSLKTLSSLDDSLKNPQVSAATPRRAHRRRLVPAPPRCLPIQLDLPCSLYHASHMPISRHPRRSRSRTRPLLASRPSPPRTSSRRVRRVAASSRSWSATSSRSAPTRTRRYAAATRSPSAHCPSRRWASTSS